MILSLEFSMAKQIRHHFKKYHHQIEYGFLILIQIQIFYADHAFRHRLVHIVW